MLYVRILFFVPFSWYFLQDDVWRRLAKTTGTDHPVPHLYDVNSFQCFLSANAPEFGVNAAINQARQSHEPAVTTMDVAVDHSVSWIMQVRYSSIGGMYVSASKDGTIRLWDGVSANCIRSIVAAHTAAEITSAIFTKDQKYYSLVFLNFIYLLILLLGAVPAFVNQFYYT